MLNVTMQLLQILILTNNMKLKITVPVLLQAQCYSAIVAPYSCSVLLPFLATVAASDARHLELWEMIRSDGIVATLIPESFRRGIALTTGESADQSLSNGNLIVLGKTFSYTR